MQLPLSACRKSQLKHKQIMDNTRVFKMSFAAVLASENATQYDNGYSLLQTCVQTSE